MINLTGITRIMPKSVRCISGCGHAREWPSLNIRGAHSGGGARHT